MIIYAISIKCNRFSLIKKAMPDISKQTLVNQLKELEEDKILERISYKEARPRVEYKITKYGQSLIPVINVMQEWGLKDLKKVSQVRMANVN